MDKISLSHKIIQRIGIVALLSVFVFNLTGCNNLSTPENKNKKEKQLYARLQTSQKDIRNNIKQFLNIPPTEGNRLQDWTSNLKAIEENVKKLRSEADKLAKESKSPHIVSGAKNISSMLKKVYDIIQKIYELPKEKPETVSSTLEGIKQSLKETVETPKEKEQKKSFLLKIESFISNDGDSFPLRPMRTNKNKATYPATQNSDSKNPFIVIEKPAYFEEQFILQITSPRDTGKVTITRSTGNSVSIAQHGGIEYRLADSTTANRRYYVTLKNEGVSVLTIRKEATKFHPAEERTLTITVPELEDYCLDSMTFAASKAVKKITYNKNKNIINTRRKGNKGEFFILTFKQDVSIKIDGLAKPAAKVPYEGELKIETLSPRKYKIIVNEHQTFRDRMIHTLISKDFTLVITCHHNKERTITIKAWGY